MTYARKSLVSLRDCVAIVKKRMNLPRTLYESLQILSLSVFQAMPLDQLLARIHEDPIDTRTQLNLFD
jgi:hypothetical protein